MKTDKHTFLDVMEAFINSYLPLERGCSNKTVESYKTTYRLLLNYLYEYKQIPSDQISFEKLDYETIIGFLDWLQESRKCSVRTRNQRLAALNSFSKYARNICLEAAFLRNTLNKIPQKKVHRSIKSTFTLDEVQILLAMPDDRTEIGRRDKVLLSVMYGAGTRCEETCQIKIKNIRFNKNGGVNIDIIKGKGGKSRSVWISEPCARIIKGYIHHRGIADKPETYLFKSQMHERMSVSAIEEVYKKYIAKAKQEHPDKFRNDDYTPHTMRRSAASHMLEAGIPMEVIRTFLGHSSIYTTELYAILSQKKMDAELKNWASKWFPENAEKPKGKSNIPSFLQR